MSQGSLSHAFDSTGLDIGGNAAEWTSTIISAIRAKPTVALLVGILSWAMLSSLRRRRHSAPGPPRLPLLGNILQVPKELQFTQFTEWSEKYGPIFSLDFPGRHVVVLNTFKAAVDLFDRCSNIYNSRPRLVMASEILGGNLFMPLVGDINVWRRFRRAAHEGFSARAVEKFQPIQVEAAAIAALRTIAHPDKWEHNMEIYTASSIYSSVYGWPALDAETSYAKLMQDFVTRITSSAAPGAYLVDLFPIMKYIPTWMAKWKRDGLAWHEEQSKVFEGFNASADTQIEAGELHASFAAELVQSERRHGFSKKESAWLSSIMIAGGTDTSATVLTNFVLAMLHYPEVMRKAQAELDAVVGRERAPAFQDKQNLPYIRALIKETLRWRPIAPLCRKKQKRLRRPGCYRMRLSIRRMKKCLLMTAQITILGRRIVNMFEDALRMPAKSSPSGGTFTFSDMGVPHKATEDNWYEGYFIPKGTVLIGNIWAMNRDPSIFPDYDVYRPERFLDATGKVEVTPPDTHQMGHSSFGFGRRICVGMHFAEQAVFIGVVTLLWAFNIKPAVDSQGNEILPPTDEWVDSGLVVRAPPFPAQLSPRFPEVQSILEANIELKIDS